MQNHETSDEAKKAFLARLEEAVQTGRWMAVVWSDNGQALTLDKTTFCYPSGEYQRSLLLLKELLDRELGLAPMPEEPLPEATL